MIEGGLGGMNLSLEHASPRMQKIMRKNLKRKIMEQPTKYTSATWDIEQSIRFAPVVQE